jgi:hypothetical protein
MLHSGLSVPVLAGAMLAALPVLANGQGADLPDVRVTVRQLAAGGDVAIVAGPRDSVAFFNYTDYERNALRIARFRGFGEWRPHSRFSVIAEARTENLDDFTMPALYVRWQLVDSEEIFVQAGRVPQVIGGFARHAYGRDNIVIGQPLAYQYLTSLRADALPATTDELLRMRGRGWQPSFTVGATRTATGVPLISVSKGDTGIAAIWRRQWLEVAAAVTRGSPSTPVVRETNGGLTWSARVAGQLPGGATLGLSGARGQWLADDVLALAPRGTDHPAAQSIVGLDLEAGRGRWLVRGEWLRSVFELPLALEPNPDTRLSAWSAFVEARYRLHPRWQLGVRADRLDFSSVRGTLFDGAATSWDAAVDRVEGVLGFRATRRVELRGGWQHNWRDGGRLRERGLPTLGLLYWF